MPLDTPEPAADQRISVSAGGLRRSYWWHPAPAAAAPDPPVWIVLHGRGSSASGMMEFCGLNEHADRHGFHVVYPQGTSAPGQLAGWNAGECCDVGLKGVDDVEFLDLIIADLQRHTRFDAHRVYVVGMSNGGMLAYRYAAARALQVAGVAVVAGCLAELRIRPERPVRVLHFHGTADEFVPIEGGVGQRSLSQVMFLSVDYTLRAWCRANGCDDTPRESLLSPGTGNGLPVRRFDYAPRAGSQPVSLVRIEGGGHTWPGRVPTFPFLGRSTLEVSANELISEFFDMHARR